MKNKNSFRFSEYYSAVSRFLFGSYKSFTLENRIYNAASVILFISGIITLIFNIINKFPAPGIITVGCMAVIFLFLYYLGRFKMIYNAFVFFLFSVAGISFLWFFNEGLNGSIPVLFIMCTIFFVAVTKTRFHFIILIIIIAIFALLYILEYLFYEELITEYPNETLRKSDIIFAYILSIIVAVLFINGFKRNYNRENKIIKEQRKELEEINAVKDRLFSIIGHDLRNQFNCILGFSDLILTESKKLSSEKIQNYAKQAQKSSESAYKLLNDLLDWARLHEGTVPFGPEDIHLNLLINEEIFALKYISNIKKIKIELNLKEDVYVYADKNMLKTIIRNLISNSIKFTPSGGFINLSVNDIDSEFVCVSVEDTGIGMDEDIKKNLFILSSKTKRPGTEGEPSTGLGLLLCNGFIEKHNSKIDVESEPGKGSKFSFTLQKSK